MKPYYEHAGIAIYHGDFRVLGEYLPLVSCAITDPPYAQTSLAWDKWLEGWPLLVAAHTSSLWSFGTLRMFMDHAAEFACGWKMSQDLVWEKQNGSSFHADRFRRVHEQAVHFYRGQWEGTYKSAVKTMDATARQIRLKSRRAHMGNIDSCSYISHDGGPRLMRSVIYEPNCHGFAENETQKPLAIVRPLIEYSCPPDGIVLDPFMGSGTTLVVAKQMQRRAIGVDVREEQCEVAANRLGQEVFDFEVTA